MQWGCRNKPYDNGRIISFSFRNHFNIPHTVSIYFVMYLWHISGINWVNPRDRIIWRSERLIHIIFLIITPHKYYSYHILVYDYIWNFFWNFVRYFITNMTIQSFLMFFLSETHATFIWTRLHLCTIISSHCLMITECSIDPTSRYYPGVGE